MKNHTTINEGIHPANVRHRSNKHTLLKKQTSCVEQHPKPTKTLRHSASLERFPGHLSWLKPSLSLGNIPSQRQRLHGGIGGAAFNSSESLLEEPELMDPNSEFSTATNYFGRTL